jgi:cell division control protein 45
MRNTNAAQTLRPSLRPPTAQPTAKLKEMLAKMGVPLDEAKQSWAFMKPEFRKKVKAMIHEYKEEYGLPDVEVEGFKMVTGFNSTVSSSDVALAVRGILDTGSSGGEAGVAAVAEAVDSLKVGGTSTEEGSTLATLVNGGNVGGRGISRGIALAKTDRVKVMEAAVSMVEKSEIVAYKHFRFAYIHATGIGANGGVKGNSRAGQEKDKENNNMGRAEFGTPGKLGMLANFLMDVHRENGKWKGRKAKPLVLLAERPEDGMYLVGAYNCMEKSGTVANNKFGRRFEIAARQCGGGEEKVMRERFDDFVVEVPRKTVQNFVQQLHVIMEQ